MRVALVLGAAVRPDGTPSPALSRRAQHGAALFREGRVDHLLLTGGTPRHPPAEARLMAAICAEGGVPPEAMTLEPDARSTRENMALSAPLLAALGATEVLLVTDDWHQPRAALAARRHGIATRPAPPPPSGVRRGPAARLREALARAWYRLTLPRPTGSR